MCVCVCVCVCVRVCVSKACVSVSISPWQHSSKTEPVRGLCLTSLFNQTQTHTSGQPGPRYLSLPPSARCTHPALSLLCALLLLFQHSSSASLLSLSSACFSSPPPPPPPSSPPGSAPLCITLSPGSSSFSTSCVLLLVPPTPPPPSYSGLLSLLATWLLAQTSGAAASKTGAELAEDVRSLAVWCPAYKSYCDTRKADSSTQKESFTILGLVYLLLPRRVQSSHALRKKVSVVGNTSTEEEGQS